jgi:hypothetical protein
MSKQVSLLINGVKMQMIIIRERDRSPDKLISQLNVKENYFCQYHKLL